jgi:hypothetical protein
MHVFTWATIAVLDTPEGLSTAHRPSVVVSRTCTRLLLFKPWLIHHIRTKLSSVGSTGCTQLAIPCAVRKLGQCTCVREKIRASCVYVHMRIVACKSIYASTFRYDDVIMTCTKASWLQLYTPYTEVRAVHIVLVRVCSYAYADMEYVGMNINK